ncbi:hypothetical protein [Sphingomonas sp. PAMC 26605]|uniref:hypothetical protein n=1 Tax=Sphingomonas sp. PAMC 26605 TaxID=1112214 RepID=UPI0012F49C5E|nr:hypothetical protein [Sphingomonas sp. PAMC 26605]
MFSFVPTTLDSDTPDSEAVMILRDGRLLAVASCLSGIHGALAGHWYIESAFRGCPIGLTPRSRPSARWKPGSVPRIGSACPRATRAAQLSGNTGVIYQMTGGGSDERRHIPAFAAGQFEDRDERSV